MVEYIILGITALCIVVGCLGGLIKGANKQLDKFICILLSVVVAFTLRLTIADKLINIEVEG